MTDRRIFSGIRLVENDCKAMEKLQERIGKPIAAISDSVPCSFGFEARNNRVIRLWLSGMGLRNLPDSILELDSLCLLSLCNNALTVLP